MAPDDTKPTRKLNILFIHPDLGIGGAERLVVDAAVGLQELGHEVTVVTSHCDPNHCFDEARDGTLNVHVRGNTIILPNLLGRFSILCAILRQLHLVLSIYRSPPLSPSSTNSSHPTSLPPSPDVIFIDQLSTSIPLLRLLLPSTKILFYCHFPDYLLTTRTNLLKRLYRLPFDFIEEYTTSKSHCIVVNSRFTASVFAKAFKRISVVPRVVYPCVDTTSEKPLSPTLAKKDITSPPPKFSDKKIILSINRFERKKYIELAIKSFSLLSPAQRAESLLIICGGYDPRNTENISYHQELTQLCDKLGLEHATCRNYITALSPSFPNQGVNVLFLLSVPASWKGELLRSARLLVYTPSNEHFGIVPLEAMVAGVPVLAVNNGGPLETVVEGVTGWLRPPEEEKWMEVMRLALWELEEREWKSMGEEGRRRVQGEFSKERMARRLQSEMGELVDGKVRGDPLMGTGEVRVFVGVLVGLVAVGILWFGLV